MVCPKCSTPHTSPYTFCPDCGERLNAAPAAGANGAGAPALAARVDEAAQAARLLEEAFDLYDAGQYDEALGNCQAAIALAPSGSTAHSLLGMIYERLGKTAEAVEQYQFVLRMNPDSLADAIKLEALIHGPHALGRRGLSGFMKRGKGIPLAAGVVVAAVALAMGLRATSRAMDQAAGRTHRLAARSTGGPLPGPSLPPAATPATEMPGADTRPVAATRSSPPVPAPSSSQSAAPAASAAALPAPPPANAFPGLRGAYPPHPVASASGSSFRPGESMGQREARSPGYLAPAPVLNVEKVDPRRPAAPMTDVPGPSLPVAAGTPRAGKGVPVLPPVTGEGAARPDRVAAAPIPPLPVAATTPPAPPSANISIQPLDDSAPAQAESPSRPPARPPNAAPAAQPPSLRDALQHEQMAAYYRRQGDDQAAYSEYHYARDLFRQLQQRGGREAAVAAEGAIAAQNGMTRLQGP